ncbi:hypothetical protein ACLK1S_16785 [Escherichia coli]
MGCPRYYGLIPVGLPDDAVVWCCRMTRRMNFIRCAKTAWIIVSVRTHHRC